MTEGVFFAKKRPFFSRMAVKYSGKCGRICKRCWRWGCHNVNFSAQKTLKKLHFYIFLSLFVAKCPKRPYLCIVFFIVLDLRLTRLGYSGIPFFLPKIFRFPELTIKESRSPDAHSASEERDFLLFFRIVRQRFSGSSATLHLQEAGIRPSSGDGNDGRFRKRNRR